MHARPCRRPERGDGGFTAGTSVAEAVLGKRRDERGRRCVAIGVGDACRRGRTAPHRRCRRSGPSRRGGGDRSRHCATPSRYTAQRTDARTSRARRAPGCAARAVSSEVKQGMRISVAARRMWNPSRMCDGRPPSSVLITAPTVPSLNDVHDVGAAPRRGASCTKLDRAGRGRAIERRGALGGVERAPCLVQACG